MYRCVEDELSTARAELRRRTRRYGFVYIASSPVVGIFLAILSRPRYGVVVGALSLASGVYLAFAYASFAEWLRRREQSR
jgi:membrane associated rhomboid family serine protease